MPNIYKANFFEDENRGEKKNPPPKKKKPNFKTMKKNTVKSPDTLYLKPTITSFTFIIFYIAQGFRPAG